MGIPKKTLKTHDLSCPNCGRVNCVRLIGAYERRGGPDGWNCRCEGCGKEFTPRKLPGGGAIVTGRNTRITKSRLGAPRFPPRPPEPPAEVKVYYMPVEEVIKKYGPPNRPLRRSQNGALDYRSIAAAVRTSAGPVEAAELLGIKPGDLQRYIRHYKIQPRYGLSFKKKEEEETMGPEGGIDVNAAGNESELISQPGTAGPGGGVKTALERARELLPKEKLAELKAAGKTDEEIMNEFEIVNTYYYALKKEYGLTSRSNKAPAATGEEAGHATEGRMTVARAVEVYKEIVEDLDDLNRIMNLATMERKPSERVISLLSWYCNQYQLTLTKINQAFCNTWIML